MANEIANLLLRFASESGDAKRDIRGLIAELGALESTDAEANATVDVDDGDLAKLSAALQAFGKQKVSATADVKTAAGLGKLAALHKAFRNFLEETATPPVIDLDEVDSEVRDLTRAFQELAVARDALAHRKEGREARASKLTADIAQARNEIEKLQATDPRLQLDADIVKLNAELEIARKKRDELFAGVDKGKIIDPLVIERAEAKVTSLLTKIEKLTSVDPTVQVNADIRKALATLALLEEKLEKQQRPRTKTGQFAKKDPLQIEKTLADIDVVEAKILRLRAVDPKIQIAAQVQEAIAELEIAKQKRDDLLKSAKAQRAEPGGERLDTLIDPLAVAKADAVISTIEARLEKLTAQHPEVDIELKVDKLRAQIANLEAQLTQISDLDIEADLKTARLRTQMTAIAGEIALLEAQKADIEVNVDRDGRARESLRKILSLFKVFGSASSSASGSGSQLGNVFKGLTVNVGSFGARLSPVVGLILGIALAIMGALVAALVALASSLAFAVAALLAFSTALAAAAGPAVLVLIALLTRLTAVWKALEAEEKAVQDETKKTAEGMQAAKDAAEQRRQATLRVADALRAIGTAERNYGEAVRSTEETIRSANLSQESAARSLQAANEDLADATVDGYEAMENAARDLEQAILSLEGAKLGIEEAELATRQAENALKQLRDESGAAGEALDAMFKKFTDISVRFDPAAVAGSLAGMGVGEDEQLKMEAAILRVRRAKINEKQATLDLKQSEDTLSDARRTQNEFLKRGIAAYDPLISAIRSQQDATLALAEATRTANRLNEQGVKNAPAVISAYEALTAARRAYNEALRQQAITREKTQSTPSRDEAERQKGELSGAELGLMGALAAAKSQLSGFFAPITDQIIEAIRRAVTDVPGILAPLRDGFGRLGGAFAYAIDSAMAVLKDPKNAESLQVIVNGAAELVRILGGQVFSSLLQIFLDIAREAMPGLLELARRFSTMMQGFAGKAADREALSNFLKNAAISLFKVLALIGAVTRIFLALFNTGREQGNSLLDLLIGMATAIANFLESARGQEMLKEFFADMIPLAISFAKFLGQFLIFMLQTWQAISPALTSVLNVITDLLRIINLVVKAIMPLLQVGFQLAVFFAGFMLKAIRGVILLLSAFAGWFPRIYRAIVDFVTKAVAVVSEIAGTILDWLTWPFRKFFEWFDKIGGWFLEAGAKIVNWIAEGIKKAPGALYGALKDVLGPVGDLLPGSEPKDPTSPLRGLKSSGEAIFENIIRGVQPGSRQLTAALHRSLVPAMATVNTNIGNPTQLQSIAPAGAGNGTVIEHQEVILPEPPGGGVFDARTSAIQYAREMRRRGI